MVALGASCLVVLIVAAVLVPGRRNAQESVMQAVTQDIYAAVNGHDAEALGRARERLRRVSHDDLLGRSVPGVLRVVEALAKTPPDCDARAGVSFQRGICLIRRGRFDDALLAFVAVPYRRGGAVYRDVAVRLLAFGRAQQRPVAPGEPDSLGRGGAQ